MLQHEPGPRHCLPQSRPQSRPRLADQSAREPPDLAHGRTRRRRDRHPRTVPLSMGSCANSHRFRRTSAGEAVAPGEEHPQEVLPREGAGAGELLDSALLLMRRVTWVSVSAGHEWTRKGVVQAAGAGGHVEMIRLTRLARNFPVPARLCHGRPMEGSRRPRRPPAPPHRFGGQLLLAGGRFGGSDVADRGLGRAVPGSGAGTPARAADPPQDGTPRCEILSR